MAAKRKVEVFTAGCSVCDETVQLVKRIVCESCDVTVLDMDDAKVAERAKSLGVRSIPAVVVNGQLATCCADVGPNEEALRNTGIGQVA